MTDGIPNAYASIQKTKPSAKYLKQHQWMLKNLASLITIAPTHVMLTYNIS